VSGTHGASLVGRRLGVYQVVAPLGAGGMGEVYRARDARLGRDVALKVLPTAFALDSDRLTRFEREARALAALNHPNIAAIYGVEDIASAPGAGQPAPVRALVLELVEGDTLAERIRRPGGRRGAAGLPLDEVLGIARQIADALDAAHEKGIVHRDLKPANIKITPGGVVKVLDFGLAKLAPGVDSADAAATGSPTLTAAGTREGLILGTAAYMSPEQARGQAVDKRTDIWAFGCVLYEMLTGRAAFACDTITDTLAAILEREPDWSVLPETTPPEVRRLLRRCVDKNPTRRLRDVADARGELEDVSGRRDDERASGTRVTERRNAATWALVAAAVAVAAGVGGSMGILSRRAAPATSQAVARTTIVLPAPLELDTGAGAGPLAIAPDGSRLGYVAYGDGRTQLYVRDLDAFEAKAIAGTEGAQYPFFSPDGEWVAFFADRRLKRVSIRGGSPITICDAPAVGRGGTWSPDGTIVFDPGDSGLVRVPATGGAPEPLTSQDPTTDRNNLSWPQFLPEGRGLLVTLNGPSSVDAELAVLTLATGQWRRLGPGSQAQYLPSGHLLYHATAVREGELHVVAFDPETLALAGSPVALLDGVLRSQDGGGAYFAVAQNGTLVFTPGGYARTLVRVDRDGRRTPVSDDRRGFRHPEVSPDGTKVAVTIDPRPSQVWVYDILRRTGIPLAAELHNLGPLWTPDGRRVTYTSAGDIVWRAADAGTAGETLLVRPRPQYPTSWSRDGRLLVFNENNAGDKYDIWVLPANEQPRPLLATENDEAEGRLSPDERWIAYRSDESGRREVYVRRFPDVNAGKWSVSTSGGHHPVWSPDGRELFYALGSSIFRVPIDTRGDTFVAGTPQLLFSGPYDLLTTEYAVTPDGESFIMVEADPNGRPTQIQVVLNWIEEVKRLVPASGR
jgi:Tol biopolymer transport system component